MSSAAKFQSSRSPVRLHVFAGERLQAFSDAVFAIIATLMVVPLKLEHECVKASGGIEEFDLDHFMLEEQWPRYLIYAYSFSLVVDMWYSHVGIFSIVEQVDDVIIWLNLLCLMLISFLPYGIGLVGSYPAAGKGEHLAITICSLDLLFIGISMLLILLYTFRKQSLLHPEIENDANLVSIRRASVVSVLITPSMSLLAFCFSFLTAVPQISLLLFYSISAFSFLSRLGVYLYYKRRKFVDKLPCHLFNSVGSTFRTEAFSDGVFSIVATLIVLDLTTGIPDSIEDLDVFLKDQKYVVISYLISFVVVGLLWFVHYGMIHFIVRMTPVLSFLNNINLLLVGCIPFVSGIDSIFSETVDNNEDYNSAYTNKSISIRVFSVIVFLASMGQFVFWTAALWTKEKCMSRNVDERCSETLQFFKLTVFPIISFTVFWCTYSQTFMYYGLYNYMMFCTPFIFLILKSVFRRRDCGRKHESNLHDREVNTYVDERTALIGGKAAPNGSGDIEIPTTRVRITGKGEEADVEVTIEKSDSQ